MINKKVFEITRKTIKKVPKEKYDEIKIFKSGNKIFGKI